jgi:hypothetical protein
MSSAKEKAKDLVYKFYPSVQWKLGQEDCLDRAKQCALIAVDELLSETEERDGMRVINNPYWMEVKNEIEKL